MSRAASAGSTASWGWGRARWRRMRGVWAWRRCGRVVWRAWPTVRSWRRWSRCTTSWQCHRWVGGWAGGQVGGFSHHRQRCLLACLPAMPHLGPGFFPPALSVQAVSGALREREAALLTLQSIEEDLEKRKRAVTVLEDSGARRWGTRWPTLADRQLKMCLLLWPCSASSSVAP
jgi:hypothetical protein